ncbi:MAG: EVE domain-containing protein [Phycisphaerae bacterium]
MTKKTKSKVAATAVNLQTSSGFWLAKSEPDVYGIADLKRDKRTLWEGVRNYQARNFMRAMKKGDRVLFYHSNADPSGVAGVATVSALAQPDPLQFDKRSEFFDSAATKEQPRWSAVELAFEKEFARVISLEELRAVKALSTLLILQRGNRLSVTPVQPAEFHAICALA